MSTINPFTAPINNFGELKTQVLTLISAEQDAQAKNLVTTWCRFGLLDCFDIIRPYWAIRAALVTIEEDNTARLPPSYIAMNAIFPVQGGVSLTAITAEQAGLALLETSSWPKYYLIEGTQITFFPFANTTTQYRLSYWSELTPLVNPNDTNAWITRAGAAVMFASARYAMEYQENDEALQRYDNAFKLLADQITGVGVRARTGTGLVMRRSR